MRCKIKKLNVLLIDIFVVCVFCQNTDFRLLAAVYNVRGEFLRWEQVGGQNLQVKPFDYYSTAQPLRKLDLFAEAV